MTVNRRMKVNLEEQKDVRSEVEVSFLSTDPAWSDVYGGDEVLITDGNGEEFVGKLSFMRIEPPAAFSQDHPTTYRVRLLYELAPLA